MLSSSDAKWRCMWHMFIWSVLLTLASQFLYIMHHIAFFLMAGVSVIALPILTAVYSNSSGERGLGLLRAGYIIFDPVMMFVMITPVLILSHLPSALTLHFCLQAFQVPVTQNMDAFLQENMTTTCVLESETRYKKLGDDVIYDIFQQNNQHLKVIQFCLVLPILTALSMGRRTNKMNPNTLLLSFCYWLIAGIDASTLLETAVQNRINENVIFTTEAIVSIMMILANSYAIISLCSFINPKTDVTGSRSRNFTFAYHVFTGLTGIFFVEIPLVIARLRIVFSYGRHIEQGTFYLWCFKNFFFIILIFVLIFRQKLFSRYAKFFGSCSPTLFDDFSGHFVPEKRDLYIHRKQRYRESMIRKNSPLNSQGDGSLAHAIVNINDVLDNEARKESPGHSPNEIPVSQINTRWQSLPDDLEKMKSATNPSLNPKDFRSYPGDIQLNLTSNRLKEISEKNRPDVGLIAKGQSPTELNDVNLHEEASVPKQVNVLENGPVNGTDAKQGKKVTFRIDKGRGNFSIFRARESPILHDQVNS